MSLRLYTVLAAAGVACTFSSHADDLFSITSVGGSTITATGSDVLDLSESAIETSGAFSSQSGQAIVATLNYAGVENTARFTVNAAGNNATLEFPITGFSRAFAGVDADDLADQIKDFIEDDGADAYAKVLEAVRAQSVAAVLDGNPFATTALLAKHTFNLYGLGVNGPQWANPTRAHYGFGGYDQPDATPNHDGEIVEHAPQEYSNTVGWYQITPRLGNISAGPFDGFYGGVDFAGGVHFNQTFGLAAGGTLEYLDVEGTDIFHSSFHFATPINVIPRLAWGDQSTDGRENSFGWQLTPFVTTGIGGSLDAAAGGAFVGVGGASNVHLGFHDTVVLNWGSQIVYFDGQDLFYDDFEFKTELGQTIVSTGLLATVFLDQPNGHVFLDGGMTYHTFLDDAGVDYWISPEVGLGWRISGDSRIRVSYRPSFGNADYEAHTGSINLVFAF